MAVDTGDKRASVLGLGLAALLVLPAPGSIDQPDRQHVAYSYRGIEADEAQVVTPIVLRTSVARFKNVLATSVARNHRMDTSIAQWG